MLQLAKTILNWLKIFKLGRNWTDSIAAWIYIGGFIYIIVLVIYLLITY